MQNAPPMYAAVSDAGLHETSELRYGFRIARNRKTPTPCPPIGTLSSCMLWNDPEVIRSKGLDGQFELLETFAHESHWWRYLLKCRCCGHRYMYDFYEEIDWEHGDDPQTVTWVPVTTEEEIAAVNAVLPGRHGTV